MKKLAARKTNSVKETDSKIIEQRFSKEQILAAAQYANRRDLVSALLETDKQYTKKEVDELMNKFMKGKVK